MAGELTAELLQLHPELMSSVFDGAKIGGASLSRIFPAIIGGAALLTGGVRSYTSIPEGKVGLRNHGGRLRAKSHDVMAPFTKNNELYGFVGPGFNWHSPRNGISIISLQDRNTELHPFHIQGKGRKQEVRPYLTWGVIKESDLPKDCQVPYKELIYRAITAAENGDELSQNVNAFCSENLRHILRDQSDPEMVYGKVVQPQLIKMCGSTLLNSYGVEIRRVNIVDVAFSEADTIINGRITDSDSPSPMEQTATNAELGAVLPALHLVDQTPDTL